MIKLTKQKYHKYFCISLKKFFIQSVNEIFYKSDSSRYSRNKIIANNSVKSLLRKLNLGNHLSVKKKTLLVSVESLVYS